MKKLKIIPILLLLIFTSCEKVVDIVVPSIEPKLTIDATFEVLFDENPVRANNIVKLRLSTDYFNNVISTVTNATVFLTNLSDNSIVNFSNLNSDGDYIPVNSFIPEDDIPYELTIIYKNETYKGKAIKTKSAKLESVTQGDKTIFSGEEIEIEISFLDKDNESKGDYYLFNIDVYNFLTIEDRFFNGTLYNFSYFYRDKNIKFPQNVAIKMSGISKNYYTYFRILQKQSGERSGGPFESVPSSLLGNMINTTNEANFPLGYFHISETDTFTIDLVKKK